MSFEKVIVNPQEVRFSQESISRNMTQEYECSINENGLTVEEIFKNGLTMDEIFITIPKPSSVRELWQQMEKGLIKPSDFPPIEVYKDESGITWSNDNRRLWVFRKAGVTSAPAKLSSVPLFRAPPPPEKRERMSRADYFPVVRGGF